MSTLVHSPTIRAPKHGDALGAIHIAPQSWNDGRRQNLYIRFEALGDVRAPIQDYIVYEHVIIVAGLGRGPECLVKPDPMGYRIHQWRRTDYGVIGKSSAIGTPRKGESF